ATPGAPGVAFADLGRGTPSWLAAAIAEADADTVLLTPHWGPNMASAPGRTRQDAAARLLDEGVTLIAGHSAHVFHGVEPGVLYDLGDFLDDYRVDPWLRNDLGLLFFVELDGGLPVRLEALPLALDYCHTRVARGEDASWIARRFTAACRALGTDAAREEERLVVDMAVVGARGGWR
ncbi:MAG: CapA family protein, partial [Gaiellaceae bacterium]